MEIFSFVVALGLAALLLIYKNVQTDADSNRKVSADDFKEQLEQALNLPAQSEKAWQNEPATETQLRELDERGIYLQRKLTKGQVMNVLGLFSPPDGRQVDILKHFNIPYSYKMNQTMAHCLIRELFGDPKKVEEWRNRPPTTTVRQGLLFMQGRLVNGLSHVDSQKLLDKLGMENPERYQEWKQIDRLFLESNNPEIRGKYKVRKITWKRFFESYDTLKETGIQPKAMSGEQIIEHSLRQDDRLIGHIETQEAMEPAAS
ncbi:MAG: hypothetical protein PVI92_13035 [Chromatiales bacterium]|jgi:hypothetical protein